MSVSGQPWRSTLSDERSLYFSGFDRIFDLLERLELDIPELPIDLFDFPDVDVLHNVPRGSVNRNWTAWALPRHPFHGFDKRQTGGVA
jgi:hypothetical protein